MGEPLEPMLRFVRSVAASPYAWGLYPSRSMGMLLLAQRPQFEWACDVIHVEYLSQSRRFRLEYRESPWEERPWLRECDPGEAYPLFERLLRDKRWLLGGGTVAGVGTGAV